MLNLETNPQSHGYDPIPPMFPQNLYSTLYPYSIFVSNTTMFTHFNLYGVFPFRSLILRFCLTITKYRHLTCSLLIVNLLV
jgi:hypothetical protein